MKKQMMILVVVVLLANVALADTFDAGGANQFTIEFVDISGDASSANGTFIGSNRPEGFIDPANDYRIGKYEITNNQWNKFKASYGTVTGSPSGGDPFLDAYDQSSLFTGTDVPTNSVSWYECAQFVNYLNTSTGNQAAYKFTGTQGTVDYTFSVWGPGDSGYNSDNPFRNSEAYYFLPTEGEWLKAAYWNGTSLQTYASVGDVTPTHSSWNYHDFENGYATDPYGPWDVGSGSEELNGTFDMMGNIGEWVESPYSSGDYLSDSGRGFRGGSYNIGFSYSSSLSRDGSSPNIECDSGERGFRVASVPEPCSLVLLSLGGLMLRRKRKR